MKVLSLLVVRNIHWYTKKEVFRALKLTLVVVISLLLCFVLLLLSINPTSFIQQVASLVAFTSFVTPGKGTKLKT